MNDSPPGNPPAASAFSGPTPERPQFFPEGPESLRLALADYLSWLGREAAQIEGLRGLLLAGGYGRGEGGIYFPKEGEPPQLYNDLEFYVFAARVPRKLVRRWVHEGEQRFGIEIEFKVMVPEELESAAPSMFYYDLLNGHELIAGDPRWVQSLPARLRDARQIPLVEGSRLLINRGMSLLRCMRWARGERDLPPDFCARICAKAKLALADAVLVAGRKYHWSCRRRHELLPTLDDTPPDWRWLVSWHAEGVDFKFHPRIPELTPNEWQTPLRDLMAAWVNTFLWVESRRCGSEFPGPMAYAGSRRRMFPEESAKKNLLRQLRDLRKTPRIPFQWGDHPRAAIWRAAALLLDAAGKEPGEAAAAELQRKASEILGLSSALPGAEMEEHLRACWARYP